MLECKQNHRKKPRMLLVLNWYDLTQKFDCFSDSLHLGQVSLNPVWDKKIYSQRNISAQGSFLQNKPILLSPPFCSNSCRAGSNAVWHLWLKPVLSTKMNCMLVIKAAALFYRNISGIALMKYSREERFGCCFTLSILSKPKLDSLWFPFRHEINHRVWIPQLLHFILI